MIDPMRDRLAYLGCDTGNLCEVLPYFLHYGCMPAVELLCNDLDLTHVHARGMFVKLCPASSAGCRNNFRRPMENFFHGSTDAIRFLQGSTRWKRDVDV